MEENNKGKEVSGMGRREERVCGRSREWKKESNDEWNGGREKDD